MTCCVLLSHSSIPSDDSYEYCADLSLIFCGLCFKLLDTGLFHADPHPGNLIRTPEGKLAILDFGNLPLPFWDLQWFCASDLDLVA